jgi:hypothetical protein
MATLNAFKSTLEVLGQTPLPGIGAVTTALLRVIRGLQVIENYFTTMLQRTAHGRAVIKFLPIGNIAGRNRLAATCGTDGTPIIPRFSDWRISQN